LLLLLAHDARADVFLLQVTPAVSDGFGHQTSIFFIAFWLIAIGCLSLFTITARPFALIMFVIWAIWPLMILREGAMYTHQCNVLLQKINAKRMQENMSHETHFAVTMILETVAWSNNGQGMGFVDALLGKKITYQLLTNGVVYICTATLTVVPIVIQGW